MKKTKKIKEQVNINPEKKNKKRWVFLSLSIGLVSMIVIVAIAISLSLRDNPDPIPTPAYEGVHYDNSPLPGPCDMMVSPTVRYSIDIEKDNYDYNEEFIIKYTIKYISKYDVEDNNDLSVKIVSDKFEFLSPTEYHFDLETDISTYGNILSFGDEEKSTIYPIEMELKVKAKEPTETIETINMDNIVFLLEFPLKDDYKNNLVRVYEALGDTGEIYDMGVDKFTKNFEWFYSLYFLNDDLGTLLVDDGKVHEYYAKAEKRMNLICDYYVTPYKSLNRLYEKGLITKDDYLDRLIGYWTGYKTIASIHCDEVILRNGEVISSKGSMAYTSKNIRVYFKWRPEYLELYEKYHSKYDGKPIDSKGLGKELVGILYERKIISFEQYTAELQLIEEKEDGHGEGVYKEAFIPFDVPMELYYDYIVE